MEGIMKKALLLGLVLIPVLFILITGCQSFKQASPAAKGASQMVEISLDEFAAQNTILKYVEMLNSEIIIVKLGSNPSTGYTWSEAAITHPDVIKQISRNYEEPANTGVVGAGGTEVWVFKAADTGLAMIKMTYSRPGESGGAGIYNVTVNINVR
jgi:inhibitor of cysteine peptidase